MTMELKPYPAMKDSGVEWLGAVPEHWAVRRFKYILRETDVRSIDGSEQLLRVSQYTGVTERKNVAGSEEPDTRASSLVGYKRVHPDELVVNIMLAWNGSMGVSAFDGIASPAYCVYRFNDQTAPSYFHNLLRSPAYKARIKVVSAGIVESRLRLYTDDLYRLEALLPPLSDQAAIVRYLDHVDRRVRRFVRAKQKLIGLLEEQKQAIIHRAVTRGLDPDVPLKDSGVEWLGDVPAHWEVRRLKNVVPEITVGVVVNPSSYFTDDGVPILLGNNVRPGRFLTSGVRRISEESNAKLRKSQLRHGDVVVVRVGAPGVAALVPPELDGCNCASMMIIRRGQDSEPLWIEYLFNSPVMRIQIDMVKYGAAQKQFNIGHAAEFLTLVPPLEEQRAILGEVSCLLAATATAIRALEKKIELLREYHTRLIADVVTGKLDVRDVAAKLPEEPGDLEMFDGTDRLRNAGVDAGASPEEAKA